LIKPTFKPDFYRELARDNPFGITLHWREVEAWFEYIAWPAYKTYNYKLHLKATRRWWARCSMQDLERARDAMDNVKFERAEEELKRFGAEEWLEASPFEKNTLTKIMGGKGGQRP
jgi:hypothetical protein